MSSQTIAVTGLGSLAVCVVCGFGPFMPTQSAAGEPPQAPGKAKAAPQEKPQEVPPPPDEPPPEDGGIRAFVYNTDQAIQFFQGRVRANPRDFVSFRHLGEFYERKAKETGDSDHFAQAESALRRSLELFPDYTRAQSSLAAVLCDRHKFAEALEIARKLLELEPGSIDALATQGDALLELGEYPQAEKAIRDLLSRSPTAPVLARLANLMELKGDPDEALRLMRQAAEAVRKAGGGPKAVAWYQVRLGDITYNTGRIEDAARFYEAVPQGVDAYHDATAGLARVRAAQGRLEEAIALYEKAVAIGPDPHMLAALGDLYIEAGKADKAEPLFEKLVQRCTGKGEYLRTLSLFYSDHDRAVPLALELAERDFAQRKDVYGYDALAWALSKNGRQEDAAKAIAGALKLGTKDAKIYYHAGMLYLKLNDKDKSRQYLKEALDLNPHFSGQQARHARQTLAELDGQK